MGIRSQHFAQIIRQVQNPPAAATLHRVARRGAKPRKAKVTSYDQPKAYLSQGGAAAQRSLQVH